MRLTVVGRYDPRADYFIAYDEDRQMRIVHVPYSKLRLSGGAAIIEVDGLETHLHLEGAINPRLVDQLERPPKHQGMFGMPLKELPHE